jgi:hypothetical protein
MNRQKVLEIQKERQLTSEEIISFHKNEIGFEGPRIPGWEVLIKLFISDEFLINEKGERTVILTNDMTREEDKWNTCTGTVLSIGHGCYKGERFHFTGPYCQVGDYVTFRRSDAFCFLYRGIPLCQIFDTAVKNVPPDPSYVTRT